MSLEQTQMIFGEGEVVDVSEMVDFFCDVHLNGLVFLDPHNLQPLHEMIGVLVSSLKISQIN